MKVAGFDIGAQNMGLCIAEIDQNSKPTRAPNIPFRVPAHQIVKIIHFHPNIRKEDSYARRADVIYGFVDAEMPESIDEFRIEQQYINFANPHATNYMALGLSHILLGILKAKYPNAVARMVSPPIRAFRRRAKNMSDYALKNEIMRAGQALIAAQDDSIQKAVTFSSDSTHMLEAMFIALM